jgi:hypothetical protein
MRAGLIFLAVTQGLAGLVQLFAPKRFYDIPWVSLLPPYNEHLMRDVGALTLAYVLVLAVAAVSLEPVLVRTALAANLVFTVPHFVFHATHLEHYPLGSAIGQTAALGAAVAIPATMLVVSLRKR